MAEQLALRLAIAGLIGLATGLERASTLLKLGISVLVGRATYRRRAGAGLVALAAGATASLLWF
jgi:hypothetical protein